MHSHLADLAADRYFGEGQVEVRRLESGLPVAAGQTPADLRKSLRFMGPRMMGSREHVVGSESFYAKDR